MALALLIALQAAAPVSSPTAPAAPPPLIPDDFDLARLRSLEFSLRRRGCEPQDSSTILVCGTRPRGGDYPLEEWERIFAEGPLVAETGLVGDATIRAYVEAQAMPNGDVSNRAMVGVRLPF